MTLVIPGMGGVRRRLDPDNKKLSAKLSGHGVDLEPLRKEAAILKAEKEEAAEQAKKEDLLKDETPDGQEVEERPEDKETEGLEPEPSL